MSWVKMLLPDCCDSAAGLESNDHALKGGCWLGHNRHQHHPHHPQQHDQSLLEPPSPQQQWAGAGRQRGLHVHDNSSLEHQQSRHSQLLQELVEKSTKLLFFTCLNLTFSSPNEWNNCRHFTVILLRSFSSSQKYPACNAMYYCNLDYLSTKIQVKC